MSDLSLIEKEAATLHDLERLAAERARAEAETEQGYRVRKEVEERGFQESLQKLTTTGKAEIDSTQARYQAVKKEVATKAESEKQAVEKEFDEAKRKAAARAVSVRKAAKKDHEETRWQILAVFEANKDGTLKRHKQQEAELAAALEHLHEIHDAAVGPLAACARFAPPPPSATEEPAPAVELSDDPIPQLQELIRLADEQLEPLSRLSLPKFLRPQSFVWPFLFLGAAVTVGLGLAVNWIVGGVAGAVVAIGTAVGMWVWLAKAARKQVAAVEPAFRKTIAEADALAEKIQAWLKTNLEQKKAAVEQKRESDTKAADDKLARLSADAEARREQDLKQADEKYPPLFAEVAKRREEALKQIEERYPRRLVELKEKLERDTQQLHESYRQQKEATRHAYEEAWAALIARWRKGLAEANALATEVNQVCDELFLDWHKPLPEGWKPPAKVPPALRFGQFEVDLAQIPQGIPTDPRLKDAGPLRHTLPSLTPFPTVGSMLIKAADSKGKVEAAQLLQTSMLRFATSIPAGKVRFTIIDPVSLGENFAAFMHLADYSELLITSRIWTESKDIEQRLTDLQAHMENVIQKYLRNEFQTIEEYNAHAGEVAEPFRILVVSNFPVNFNESAIRRLVSIASSGARCGVYTLLSVDMKQQLPTGFQLKDLEQYALNLHWRDGRFQWKDKDFAQLPLTIDTPPDQEKFSRLMHIVGDAARNANRVEVPFDFIAPKPEDYWTYSAAKGVDVPLGRAGATKLQHLKLGKGTSQHVLIAGKTGSGKSTLLHALIMNAALRYSPEELELYLIDFKKGVEFKVYAALQLPHAKVIAVESEREFGLSVLQRLDVELKIRGDKFRDLGVQDLGAYRQLEGQPPLPRILFVVDEFQEFFVEDDKVSQDVALLLDRMVRQGRAFGIHVHLGSQSLGGAYSLARTTLGQMAVRIALQCSESDANLILSEDNSAARLLTRPGEAIYNDQNGIVEGNNFFQVVWLSDERREDYLRRLQDLSRNLGRPPVQQIVFEGNLPAVAAKNPLLGKLIEAPDWTEAPKADYAWMGEAIAIKDPTSAVFRPQSGSNLLIVGQNDEGALGILSVSLLSLAAQHPPRAGGGGIRFYIFDGSPVDSANAGMLGKLAGVVPHAVKDVAWRDLAATLGEIAAEVERRQKDTEGDNAPIYLMVYDLQRFRDLRKSDDDFGFSRYGEEKEVPPSKNFTNILRDGPPVGVHALIWCDSLNNLNRTFDRQALREFEIRVLFQMSANDSSTLIDAPAAGKLGENRALFFSEEEGRFEKFRPYAYPPQEWLDEVRQRMARRPIPAGSNGHGEVKVVVPSITRGDGDGVGDGNGNGVEGVAESAGAAGDGQGEGGFAPEKAETPGF